MTIRMPNFTRLAIVLLVAGVVIVFSALPAGPFQAAAVQAASSNRCGAVGTYGYTGFGTVFPGNALGLPPGTASTNGTITLERNGDMSIHEVEVGDGVVVNSSASFTGTFTVNPDCTFTGSIPPLPGTALVGVVVDNGKQLRALTTIPGVQINFVSSVRINADNASE